MEDTCNMEGQRATERERDRERKRDSQSDSKRGRQRQRERERDSDSDSESESERETHSHSKHMFVGRPFAFFYSIAGLCARLLLQVVACAGYGCSRSTLQVSYEYLGLTTASMHNMFRLSVI